MSSDPYQVVPGLCIGSKEGDLMRERKKLISKWIDGDEKAKMPIFEITNELIAMRTAKSEKRR